MSVRVGLDLVAVESVEEALVVHGERYLRRIYTGGEAADSHIGGRVAPERLAARFAAKEAVMKVLRAGDEPVPWRAIEVVREPGGSVQLLLSGRAATLAAEGGITALELSLTHEHGLSAAVVVAEVDERQGGSAR